MTKLAAPIDLAQFNTCLSCPRRYHAFCRGASPADDESILKYRETCRTAVLTQLRRLLFAEPARHAVELDAGGLQARADILRRGESGEWQLGLVRAGGSRKRDYASDAAFTLFVAERCGYRCRSVVIYRPRKEYLRVAALDPGELLVCEDVTAAARQWRPRVEATIEQMQAIIADDAGELLQGIDACGRPGHCSCCNPDDDKPFDDPRTLYHGRQRGEQLLGDGVASLAELPESVKLTRCQRIQVDTICRGTPHVDREALCGFLGALRYPIRFLDFEAFSSPVPPYAGTRVWEHIPYLYTVQVIEKPGAAPIQAAYCGQSDTDYRGELAQRLVADIGAEGSVVVFGCEFESRMLLRLGRWVEGCSRAMERIRARIVDLSQPFREFWYYDRQQRGRVSMKTLLPILAGIDYGDLTIRNGLEANMTFAVAILEATPLDPEQLEALLDYCARDTGGMMLITEALTRLCGQVPTCNRR